MASCWIFRMSNISKAINFTRIIILLYIFFESHVNFQSGIKLVSVVGVQYLFTSFVENWIYISQAAYGMKPSNWIKYIIMGFTIAVGLLEKNDSISLGLLIIRPTKKKFHAKSIDKHRVTGQAR